MNNLETSDQISLTSGQRRRHLEHIQPSRGTTPPKRGADQIQGHTPTGQIAQIATTQYHVLPNEEAVKIADATAEQMGLVPFDEFTGSWFQRLDDHVIRDGFKVHALYALNEPYKVNGDEMHIGVGVHNSIDGTTSFGAGVFTFRNACRNMVLAGSKGYHQDFDQRKTLEYVYKRHTAAIDPVVGQLSHIIGGIMDRAVDIIESYKKMAKKRADEKYLDDLQTGSSGAGSPPRSTQATYSQTPRRPPRSTPNPTPSGTYTTTSPPTSGTTTPPTCGSRYSSSTTSTRSYPSRRPRTCRPPQASPETPSASSAAAPNAHTSTSAHSPEPSRPSSATGRRDTAPSSQPTSQASASNTSPRDAVDSGNL